MIKVNLKYIDENAKKLYLKSSGDLAKETPYKKHDSDFCYDVIATSCEEIAPNIYKYRLGIALQIERDFISYTYPVNDTCKCINLKELNINISLDFRPRSSVWETGMLLSNCEGTVDEEYTGEICAIFYHIFPNMPKYEVGDRIGQMKVGFTVPIEFNVVNDLNKTKRGDGGFGSTGKK